ncbi:MAG: cytochrome C oxidase subunit IV, partial [Mesorhizobium sp.]
MAEATANGLGQHTLHGVQAHDAAATGIAPAEVHQEHPIKLYLVVWVWLFILSACSY